MEMTPAAYQQAAAAHYNVWMDARSPWATQPHCPSTAKKKKKTEEESSQLSSVGVNIILSGSFISLLIVIVL